MFSYILCYFLRTLLNLSISLQLAELTHDLEHLPINTLLGAAFITYLSTASEDLRHKLIAEWQDMLGVEDFSLTHFLGSEKEQLQWLSEGLPSDQLSIENALVIIKVIILCISSTSIIVSL